MSDSNEGETLSQKGKLLQASFSSVPQAAASSSMCLTPAALAENKSRRFSSLGCCHGDAQHFWRERRNVRDHAETDIVVGVVWIVPVAVRHARVPMIVVPRTAAQHAGSADLPSRKRIIYLRGLNFTPTTQQPANLCCAFGNMLVLTWGNELQVCTKTQIKTQLG